MHYKCASIDAASGTLIGALPGGEAYPNNVEVTADGRVICGIANYVRPSFSDFWEHSPNGAISQSYSFGSWGQLLNRQLVVTPDGIVVVGLTGPYIAFVPIGGP